ncbi:MAG: hypothetical protein ACRCT8_17400 [Lacipirellulaceae bacterium]
MSEPVATIDAEVWVERPGKRYQPGDTLQGHFRVEGLAAATVPVEVSVLWYTAGQGEEDFGVAFFDRRAASVGHASGDFSAVLPEGPFSYDGQIVKVCWAARLRCMVPGGKHRVVEAPFWLVPRGEATS